MDAETLAPRADAAQRLMLMLRVDLLSAMRMLDHFETRKAHALLGMCVVALDDSLKELDS